MNLQTQEEYIYKCAKRMVDRMSKSKYYKLNGELPSDVRKEISRMCDLCGALRKEKESHRITNEELTNQILELEDEVTILKKALRSCVENTVSWEDYILWSEDDYVRVVEEYINNAKEVKC